MTREEYLQQLGDRLYSLPGDKRQEIMEYYRNYFERAGEENVDMVFRELGTPERLSQKIYEDYNRESMAYRDIMSNGAKTDVYSGTAQKARQEEYADTSGWHDREQSAAHLTTSYQEDDYSADEVVYSENTGNYRSGHRKGFRPWMLVLLIFFVPAILQLLGTLMVMLFAIPLAITGGAGVSVFGLIFMFLVFLVWIFVIIRIIIKIIKRSKR